MKLDKGIEVLNDRKDSIDPADPPEEHDAIQLGIEAITRVKEYRLYGEEIRFTPLPSETPDE